MKVQKFRQYLILEGDSPENYMETSLGRIKKKLDPLFDDSVKKMKDFKNFNLQIQNDGDVDKWSPVERSLKYKFTDEENTLYILTITIDLKDALNDKPDEEYKTSDIKKALVTFQKYGDDKDGNFGELDHLDPRNVNPEEIDGDYLIKLKVQLDEGKPEEENKEEEFEIQTEEPKEMPEEESTSEQTPNTPAQTGNGPAAPAPAQSAAQAGLPK